MTTSNHIINTLKEHEPECMMHELPIIWGSAKDDIVTDIDGRQYIDFTSGIFVANAGHGNDNILEAIYRQLSYPLIHSYVFPNIPRAELVKKLKDITSMEKVLLLVTGSEANDAVTQMMWRERPNTKILTIKGAYYGSTFGCRKITLDTIDESVYPNNTPAESIGGVFLQAFRGRDAKFLPCDWIRAWVAWAKQHDIPVGFDEMQSGIGRTGKWFGYQHFDVKPDFITIGKALGGGLPIAAVVGKAELLSHSEDLWSTHTGNPVCCAAALASLNVVEGLLPHVYRTGVKFKKLLKDMIPYPVYGEGFIYGIYTGESVLTQRIIERCAERGLLLVSTHGTAIKVGAPLCLSYPNMIAGITVLQKAIDETKNERNR